MTGLREAKQVVRGWIRTHFDDQRLAEVYAFNWDAKMDYENPCGCLLGVTRAKNLHQNCVGRRHYYEARRHIEHAAWAEVAYCELGFVYRCIRGEDAAVRQRRLSAILRAEMRRRDRLRAAARVQPKAVEVPA